MAQIVQFPTNAERQWTEFEEIINRFFSEHGVTDEELRATVLQRMKQFFLLVGRSFSLDIGLPLPGRLTLDETDAIEHAVRDKMDAIAKQIHNLTSELFFDRLTLEMKAYLAGVNLDDETDDEET